MKRTIVAISVLVLITSVLISMVLGVNAHPGRTDGSGGHTNHSTGEYHYHHGYPEHDHYDMDGDGDIDCPYDFDDQTGHSSGSGNSSSSSDVDLDISSLPTIDFDFPPLPTADFSSLPTVEPTSIPKDTNKRDNDSGSNGAVGALVAPVLVLGLWFGFVFICRN